MFPLPRISSRASFGVKPRAAPARDAGAEPIASSTGPSSASALNSAPAGTYSTCGGPSNGDARPSNASSVTPSARRTHRPLMSTTQTSLPVNFQDRFSRPRNRTAAKPTYVQPARSGVMNWTWPSASGCTLPRTSSSIKRLRLLSKKAALALLRGCPLLPGLADAFLFGDLRRHDLPPPVARHSCQRIGLDDDDRRLRRGPRVLQCGAKLGDGLRAYGPRAETLRVRAAVDRELRRRPEAVRAERPRQ